MNFFLVKEVLPAAGFEQLNIRIRGVQWMEIRLELEMNASPWVSLLPRV